MEQLCFFKPSTDAYLVQSFSADKKCSEVERNGLESRLSQILEVTEKFNRQSVSYQLSKKDILHSWLKYKEGFSANLVNILLDEMQLKKGDWIMDPFMGSGTTALVCQMRGYNCIGYDIMPISEISINAKAAALKFDISEISRMLEEIKGLLLPDNYDKKTPYITITQYAYPEFNERFLQFITNWKNTSRYSEDAKNLLTLCIINSLERSSYTSKVGQYLGWDCRSLKVKNANKERAEKKQKLLPLKQVRDEIESIKDAIIEELTHVIHDIRTIQSFCKESTDALIDFKSNSVLFELPKLSEGLLSGVITSPPYCNRYDYTRTYALELVYLGIGEAEIRKMRQDLLSCTVESKSKLDELCKFYTSINAGERFEFIADKIKNNKVFSEILTALEFRKKHGDLNNNGVIRMVDGYFTELAFIFAELYRVCKPGAIVAFVNDNVRYGGEVIPVDFLTTSFAEDFGFTAKKVYTLKQQKGNSSQQMAKFGRVPLRKSITVWQR